MIPPSVMNSLRCSSSSSSSHCVVGIVGPPLSKFDHKITSQFGQINEPIHLYIAALLLL